ncbi:S8 family serine peptidase [Actinoplanes subglobosus]|uniref:S8 family serine peptidase n=1 Tax=Actinoplanes subglobosus TaxID=1547892 RepID=A0ABV8J9E7_9ACTN
MRYRTLTVTAALTAASLTGVTPAAADAAAGTVTIGLRPGASAAATVAALDADPAVRVLTSDTNPQLNAVTVTVTGDAARALAGFPEVTYVESTPVARVTRTPDDPLQSRQWGNRVIGSPAAWDVTTGSADVVVAVVDTGVSPVSELAGRLLPGYDFVNDDADPADDNGHGTMAASVIAAAGDNGDGLAGLCWTCRILPVKVMGSNGSGGHDDIAKGIVYAVDQGAEVINMSLGGPDGSQILADAVAYAADHGVLVVASAGNDGVPDLSYPAGYPTAIAVAASTEDDGRYDWSNYGAGWVDVAAPGVNVAQSRDGGYFWFTGTSSAAPMVAGVAALGLSVQPVATAAQVRTAIETTAVPAGDWVASGRVDALGTINALTSGDVTAPAVGWSSPAASSTPRRGRMGVVAAASDPSGIARVELLRAGRVVATDTAAPWTFTFDSAGLNGSHTLTLRATDRHGNTRSANRTFLFDNTAPTITKVRATKSGGTLKIIPSIRDNVGIKQVKAVITAGSKKITLTSAKSPWTLSWKPGKRRITKPVTLTVTDRAGNTKTTKIKV